MVTSIGGGWGPPIVRPPLAIPVEDDSNRGTGTVNYCKPGMMSVCAAGQAWKEHMACKHSYKSHHNNRCMHFVMHSNCDCLAAQKDSIG